MRPRFLLVFLVALGWGCTSSNDASVVNVYTHRHYDVDQALFAQFTEETGIQVNVINASADELINRLEAEGADSPADVLITVDAGRLHRAQMKNLLQSVTSETLTAQIPAEYREPAGHWFGLTRRARVIVYAKDRVDPSTLSRYEDLTDPQWRGRILVRSSGSIYNQSLLASIVANTDRETAKQWAAALMENFARTPKGNDRDQMKALVAGEGDIAIVNTYYLGKLATSTDDAERAVAEQVALFFPNQNDRGAHVNISGAGVTAHAKNRANAIKLIEFLSSEAAQRVYAGANQEYPVHPNVGPSELVGSWGTFTADALNLAQLGIHNRTAVMIFDEIGWP